MPTWILIVTITGMHSIVQYAISDIPSYAECNRVSQNIPKPTIWAEFQFKCIEVKK